MFESAFLYITVMYDIKELDKQGVGGIGWKWGMDGGRGWVRGRREGREDKNDIVDWVGGRKEWESEGGRGKVGGRIYNRPRYRNNYSNNLHPHNKTFQTY